MLCIYHCLMVAASQLAADYRCAYSLDSDPMLMIHRPSSMAVLNFVAFSYFMYIAIFYREIFDTVRQMIAKCQSSINTEQPIRKTTRERERKGEKEH